MIYKIQEALKAILLSCTDIPETSICLSKAAEGQMQALPWASLLPANQALRPVWQWEHFENEGKLVRIRRKYDATLPFTLAVRRRTPQEASQDAEHFLAALPRRLAIDGTLVLFSPASVNPEFGAGAMDENTVHITIETSYGIYAKEEVAYIKKAGITVKEIH